MSSVNASTSFPYDHVVIVVLENHSYSEIIGSASAPYINNTLVEGNHPLANRGSSKYVARTYMAKQGSNLVLYTSPYAKDADIYAILQQEFNVPGGNIVMFDGGGSTQMICKGTAYIPSSDNRWVPSALEVYSK